MDPPLAPKDLTGRITKVDNQYCAAGSFGDVYRCLYHDERGEVLGEVAVKTFRFEFTLAEEDTSKDGRTTRMIRRELGIWKRLSHPNVVPFLGIVFGFGRLGNASLVSEWMPNGTLQHFLSEYDDQLGVAKRLQLLLGIAQGLEYLHSLSIVHGDLTCNNVLLDDDFNARLTDFGYASIVGEMPDALAYLQASTLRPGTVRWAAPEYFSEHSEEGLHHYTIKSDIYSFGNMSLQVLSGKQPWSEFPRDAVVVLHLARGHKPRRPCSNPIHDEHWEFIERCWSPIEQRPPAKYLVTAISHFLRSRPPPQPRLLASDESNSQSALRGPLLLPPTPELSPTTLALENLDPTTLNKQHGLSPNIPASLLPGATQQLPLDVPQSDSPTLLPPQRTPTNNFVQNDGCTEPTAQPDFTTSNANSDIPATDTLFSKFPPSVDSKHGMDIPNILVVGDTGVGKGSIINLIAGEQFSDASPSTSGCTPEATSYDVVLTDTQRREHHVRLFDTSGLNEPSLSKNDYLTAIEKANALITDLLRTGGIRLLIFCIRGGRISLVTQNNYRLFRDILCQNQVPVAFVLTGMESEQPMEAWWTRNASLFERSKLYCTSHVCVTTTRGLSNIYAKQYEASQVAIRNMLLEHVSRTSWKPERTGWVAHLAGKSLRWVTKLGDRRRQLPTKSEPPTVEELARHLEGKCNFTREEAVVLAGKIGPSV